MRHKTGDNLTAGQLVALAHPCLLAGETMHPRFRHLRREVAIILTVNAGYE